MAEFSKQWIELTDPEFGGWDFDIEEVAETLEPLQSIQMICEGFGFSWISKNQLGEISVAFIDYDKGEVEWKTLDELTKKH
jgi:hypothetical protein